jgi:hypothetical protein
MAACHSDFSNDINKEFNNHNYKKVVGIYEMANISRDTFDDDTIYLIVAYSYLKLNMFAKVRSVLRMVSHYNDSKLLQRIKRILATLQVKYNSFFLRTEKV